MSAGRIMFKIVGLTLLVSGAALWLIHSRDGHNAGHTFGKPSRLESMRASADATVDSQSTGSKTTREQTASRDVELVKRKNRRHRSKHGVYAIAFGQFG